MMTLKPINSLTFRQANTVFWVSVLVGLCFSMYHTLVDLHHEQKRVEEYYQFKLVQNYTNASQAAYHLNHLLAEQVVSSLMTDPAIINAAVIDDFGDVLAKQQRPISHSSLMINSLVSYLTPESPVFVSELHQPDSQIVVGKLSFMIDGNSIAHAFIAKTTRVILFDLLRNTLLTVILLAFFYRKLSRPITTLIDWVRSLPTAQSPIPTNLLRPKDELSELASSFHSLWQDKEKAQAKLNHLAYYDGLTGLANRGLLLHTLTQAIEYAHQRQQTGALFYLDLDRFKTINDSLGHTIGDTLIQSIAHRLQAWANHSYTAARVGGDEFAIIIPSLPYQQISSIAQQLLALLANPHSIDGHQLYCTASIGIATFPSEGVSSLDVFRQADTALYRAKTCGRNKYLFYEPEMQAQVETFLDIEKGLHEALQFHQLELYYQPQVNEQHQLIGVEALIRWHHPEKGLLPPGIFMPVAEETGQILPIGRWIIEQACYQLSQWQKRGVLPEHFRRLAINISPLQFSQASFVEHIVATLQQSGISGHYIELEITEGLLLENIDEAIQKIAQLKNQSLHLAIDDFGTGYSSLRYLKDLAVDVLKIDRSFVTQLHLDPSAQAIVDTILLIAKRLDLQVIAEGVEDKFELEALKTMGCTQFQGYLFDKPLTCQELEQRFTHHCYSKTS
ncbi:EAL domain-containing protein [Vibrio metschnikovii]|uniref:putative bifunctional diguanylate cyclase/phosphodiesterase n=1 Tax=Vibrio metschnikovii TaxID=28172 RepID=UPI0016487B5F|nr:EAL domain-containing protein [Vibrio metschnikovii]MBC3617872.1 EAL domain-containing protein [Vibrio metschnikovii]MBC5813910.1 EAL domain-containing protein [Vibrio metschnikovii]